MWLSLVECLVRDQEAGGSNPLTPTILETAVIGGFLLYIRIYAAFDVSTQYITSPQKAKSVRIL